MFAVSSLSDDFVHTERIRIYQALPTRSTSPHSRTCQLGLVIPASARWKVMWDLWVILLAVYSAVVEPLCIGFELVVSK